MVAIFLQLPIDYCPLPIVNYSLILATLTPLLSSFACSLLHLPHKMIL